MKLKLDENLGVRGKHVLDAAGHDACTVAAQKLTAADDRHLIEICRLEGRALVTLDVDGANDSGALEVYRVAGMHVRTANGVYLRPLPS